MYLWDDWENLMMSEYLKIPLYQKCLQRTSLSRTLLSHIQNTSIPPLILDDSSCPLEEFIMKP